MGTAIGSSAATAPPATIPPKTSAFPTKPAVTPPAPNPAGFEKKLRDFTRSAKGLRQSLETRFQDGYLDVYRNDSNAFITGYASAPR
jgi:hypothetical protein